MIETRHMAGQPFSVLSYVIFKERKTRLYHRQDLLALFKVIQPRPQGAFPWLSRPAPKAREKRPGDEVESHHQY